VIVEGSPKPYPDHATNDWHSDHAAVLTTFDVSETALELP
jgi:hypothetical protein